MAKENKNVIERSESFVLGQPWVYPASYLRLSHSTLSSFHSCPRYMELSKLYINPKYDESLATRVGTALHEGLQTYLKTKSVDKGIFAMMMAYPWSYGESPMKDRSAEGCYATLMHMIEQFNSDRYELAYVKNNLGEEVPMVETGFRINFNDFKLETPSKSGASNFTAYKEIPMYYVGYIDLILYDKIQDSYIVVDIKTTTDKLEDLSPKFVFSDQCIPYGIVLQQLLGLDYSTLNVGYYVCNVSLMSPNARFYDFQKSQAFMYDWARTTHETLTRIVNYTRDAWFPRCGSGCVSYMKPCKYINECALRNPNQIQKLLYYQGVSVEQEEDTSYDVEINLNLGEFMNELKKDISYD